MKKHRFAYFLPSFLFSSSLFLITAIGAQESLWSVDLSSSLVEVGWIEQTNDGLIIAAGSKGTMAIDNNSGKQVWLNEELKSLTKPSFQNIEGLPLFFAEYAPLAGKARAVIVNSSTGEILYNTNDNNYRIKTYQIIPDQQIILFELTEGNSRLLMNFSLKNMKEQWIANLGEIKGLIGKMENATGRESFIDHGPVFTRENKILAAVGAKIYCINKETGTLEWDYEADKKLTAMVYSPQNNSIYLGVRKSKKLTVLDPAKGEDITPGKLKLKGSLVDIVGDDENIVLVETEGFNLIDPQTNDFIWKKSFKIDYLDEVMPFDKGYIAIGKDSKDGSIAYVSTDGEKIWDTKVKGYTYYASTTSKGVLYISTERSNIISYTDGKDIWKKDVKFKSIPAVTYDEDDDKVFLFEGGTGYRFDLGSGAMEVMAEDIKLEGVKRSTPLLAEYRPNGYLLYTDQLLSLLDKSGKLTYSIEYPQVSSLNFSSLAELGLRMQGIDIDIEGSMENIKALDRLSKGGSMSSNAVNEGSAQTSVVTGMYFNESPLFEVTKTRFSNSKQTKDYYYVLTSTGSENYIYMVNKDKGDTEKKISLIDKTPQYVIDAIDDRVFLNEKNKQITCYQM